MFLATRPSSTLKRAAAGCVKRDFAFARLLASTLLLQLPAGIASAEDVDLSPEILHYDAFVWPSPMPEDCPFKRSEAFNAIKSGEPLFGETGINGYPVKIGAPHFVDFGKNMEHSPDGKAYLVAHGSDIHDTKWRFWNNSWINGDQIYLLRVTPSPETINDPSAYEFYGGKDADGEAVWTRKFEAIQPLLEWNNKMGCVTISYNAPLKKYLMCVTDGGNTVSKMNTYILESDRLEGEWKIICYMKDFGEQAYFVNIPTKFVSPDGKTFWLLYSGNFAADWNGQKIVENPPGSHYGMVFQKVMLLGADR